MTWLVAGAYVGAVVLLGRAVMLCTAPLVATRLQVPATPSESLDLLSALGRRLVRRGRTTAERLAAMGRSDRLERVLGIKASLAMLGPVVGIATWGADLAAIPASAVLAVGGWALPDVILGRRVVAWRRRTSSAVPEALDLVALAVGAGLSARLALDRATSFVPKPLGPELERARREVGLGMPWEVALRGVAERTQTPAVARLAATLSRGRRLGTPLAGPLRRLAIEVRAEERVQAEERARRAPVVMLFPLVLCILPAFVVAAVVPAVVVAIRGLG